MAADISDTVWLSQSGRVLGGNPAWALATMDIQQAAEDIFSGRTELTVGAPRQLGPTDLIGLVRKGRTDPPPLGVNSGGIPKSDPFPPDTPDPRVIFRPPNKPNVILARHNQFGTPSGVLYESNFDAVNIYDTEGGSLLFSGNLNAFPLSTTIPNVGDTAEESGVIIGHGPDTSAIVDDVPFGYPPPLPPAPTFNVYVDQLHH